MARYQVVPATEEHAHELALTMRPADVEELRHVGMAPLPALMASIAASRDAWAGLADGRVVCMFGCADAGTFLSRKGVPWLLGARELPQHAKTFLRLNRRYMDGLRLEYDYLSNMVHSGNVVALRWLNWLGFRITDTCLIIGDKQAKFLLFEMKNENV